MSMATDILLGRKPAATGDVGVGQVALNETRLTWLATPSDTYWVTHLGAHIGWDGTGSVLPQCAIAVYNATSAGVATTRLAATVGINTRSLYKANDPYGGENVERQLAEPVLFGRNLVKLGGVHAANRYMTMGQNNDGSQMSRCYNFSAPPATFVTDLRNAQGRLSMWARARKNSPPNQPSSPSPASGGQTNDPKPLISADFRDPDETLTGFGIGLADRMDAYQVIVYSESKVVKIWDSGIVAPTTTEKNARRFSIRPTVTLSPGVKVFWARVRDRAGAWSVPLEWRVAIETGGALTAETPSGRITTQTPTMTFTYEHRDGLTMGGADLFIHNGTSEIRPPVYAGVSGPQVANGGIATITWPSSWAPLPRGTTAFAQARPHASNATIGPYSGRTRVFRVNSLPLAPANYEPAAGSIRTMPGVFRCTAATDADGDDPAGFSCVGTVVSTASGSEATVFPMRFVGKSGALAVFEGVPPVGSMPSYGSYSWSATLTDQYGESNAGVGSVTFSYAEPPTITITAPPDAGVTVATPTVTYTSSPSATKHRIRWIDAITGLTVHDSKLVNATGSDQIVSGEIRTGRTYDLIVGVLTGLGAYGEVVKSVNVSYPLPATVPSQTVAKEPGQYDIDAEPTVAVLRWAIPSGVTEAAFRGYGIYRKTLDGPPVLVAVETSLATIVYADDTSPLNTTMQYWVTVFKEEGVDILESAPPTVLPQVAMMFGGTIITDISSPAMHRIVARYWLDRSETPIRAREQQEGWGQYPVLFSGERHYTSMSGVWDVHDEIEFGATALKDAMVALADPVTVQRVVRLSSGTTRFIDVLAPRQLCYRDGLGRVIFGSLEVDAVKDTKQQPHDVSWTFTETGPLPPAQRPQSRHDEQIDGTINALKGILSGVGSGGAG
jgi:hypothetical protein